MFYYISCYLKQFWPVAAYLEEVPVRMGAALVSSLLFSYLLGPWFLTQAKKFFRSAPREYTPENHKKKNNIPTMGGIFILANIIGNIFLWTDLLQPNVLIFILCLVVFGLIGGCDDWYKIHRKKGISARTKFWLQCCAACLVVCLWLATTGSTDFVIPFVKDVKFNAGLLYIPWALFIIIGCSNAVNLTDGLDGLATGSLIPNFLFFSWLSYVVGSQTLAASFQVPYGATAQIAIVCMSVAGACLGFLRYNRYPASIFMGDVGSIALGATLALVALMTKQEWLLGITGAIFVLETFSVMVQVGGYKLLKRRLLKMAPIHHHFELLGWHETKITTCFTFITVMLCLFGFLILVLR